MRCRILVGPRAGQVEHFERSNEIYRNIQLGFLQEEIEPENKQVNHIHVTPPRPPKSPQWRAYRTEISKVVALEVTLPRSERTMFFGEIPSPAYDRWLKYCGCQPPDAIVAQYQALQQEVPVDPLVVQESNSQQRAAAEEAQRASERGAAALARSYGVE